MDLPGGKENFKDTRLDMRHSNTEFLDLGLRRIEGRHKWEVWKVLFL